VPCNLSMFTVPRRPSRSVVEWHPRNRSLYSKLSVLTVVKRVQGF